MQARGGEVVFQKRIKIATEMVSSTASLNNSNVKTKASVARGSMVALIIFQALATHFFLRANAMLSVNDTCELNILEGISSVTDTLGNEMKKRLEGKTLNVISHWDPGYVYIEDFPTPQYNRPYPDIVCTNSCVEEGGLSGLNYETFMKVAEIGGFAVNWTLHRDVSGENNETYTELALNFMNDYDVGTNWWTDNMERRHLGLACGYYHVDVSRVLAVRKLSDAGKVMLTLMFKPFTVDVWIAFVCLVIFHALTFLFIEYEDPENRKDTWIATGVNAIWLSWERFTGGFDPEPKKILGKCLMSVWGFSTLCFIALYTATLAAVIIDQQNARVPINTLADLSAAHGAAMMFNSDPLIERFKSKFGYIPLDTSTPRGDILQTTDLGSLMTGDAKALIIPKIDAERLAENNCDVVITQTVIKSGGGFITSYDNCRADYNWIFDAILMQLEEEGYLETIHKKYFTESCTATANAPPEVTLGINQVGGLLMGSALLMSIILAMTSISHLSRRVLKNEGPKKTLEALKAIKVASPK